MGGCPGQAGWAGGRVVRHAAMQCCGVGCGSWNGADGDGVAATLVLAVVLGWFCGQGGWRFSGFWCCARNDCSGW